MMDEVREDSVDAPRSLGSQDRVALAISISEKVQILSIILAESQIARAPDADDEGLERKLELAEPEAQGFWVAESKVITVFAQFGLRVTTPGQGEETEPKALLSIDARFVLLYSADSL